MTDNCTPRCPRCGKPSATPHGERAYYCFNCRMAFEDGDDGTISYGPPDRRLLREERRAETAAARRPRR
jgi:hypothetical protein